MNIIVESDGRAMFCDDLCEWGKQFLNGRDFQCDIAGTVKMKNNDWDDISEEEVSSLDMFGSQEPDSVDSENEIDSLEKILNRKRINKFYKRFVKSPNACG